MSNVNAWNWFQKTPYIGSEYTNPNFFQNLTNSYGNISYNPILINGSVLGLKNSVSGSGLIAPGWKNVGSALVPLPVVGGSNVRLRLSIGYYFSGPEGRTPTWPATGRFNISVPTY